MNNEDIKEIVYFLRKIEKNTTETSLKLYAIYLLMLAAWGLGIFLIFYYKLFP